MAKTETEPKKKEKSAGVDAPATYICVGGKMIPMRAVEVDANGRVTKYHADIKKAIDPSKADARVEVLEMQNTEMAKELAAMKAGMDDLIAELRGDKKNGKKEGLTE